MLFIPGHKGTFKQARSLGSTFRLLELDMELYTIDFNEEPTLLHAGLIWQQAHFTMKAVRAIMEMHTDAPHLSVVNIYISCLYVYMCVFPPIYSFLYT